MCTLFDDWLGPKWGTSGGDLHRAGGRGCFVVIFYSRVYYGHSAASDFIQYTMRAFPARGTHCIGVKGSTGLVKMDGKLSWRNGATRPKMTKTFIEGTFQKLDY